MWMTLMHAHADELITLVVRVTIRTGKNDKRTENNIQEFLEGKISIIIYDLLNIICKTLGSQATTCPLDDEERDLKKTQRR